MDKTSSAEIVSLYGVDQIPTRIERKLFARALKKLYRNEVISADTVAVEMVKLGVPTLERARSVVMAHFESAGGLEPLQADGRPSLAGLIQNYSSKLSTAELVALIRDHHPAVTIEAIRAELYRQADLNNAEGDALDAQLRRREGRGDKR